MCKLTKSPTLLLTVVIVFASTLKEPFHAVASITPDEAEEQRAKLLSDEVQDERQRRLDVECRRLWNQVNSSTSRKSVRVPSANALIVNVRRRTAFCVVRKAASTAWLRVLLSATAPSTADLTRLTELDRSAVHLLGYDYALRTNRDRSDEELRRILDPGGNSFNVVFVREPLERLAAAFLEQVKTDEHYREVRRSVAGRSRHVPSSSVSDAAADNVTFVEFVRYVLDSAVLHPLNPLDEHWRPQHEVCSPCTAHYDFIGHHETLLRDAEHVLPRLANRRTVELFSSYSRLISSSSDSVSAGKATDNDLTQQQQHHQQQQQQQQQQLLLLRRVFEDVSSRDKRRLLELYETDYKLFGFRFPPDFLGGI